MPQGDRSRRLFFWPAGPIEWTRNQVPYVGANMKSYQKVLWASVSISALGFVGCELNVSGRPHHEEVYVQAQPQYVQPQAVYVEPQPQYIFVQQAPPPIIVERRPAPPSPAHVWIEGTWNWDNQHYVWA